MNDPAPVLLYIRYRCPCCRAGHAVRVHDAGTVRRCRACHKAVRIPTPRPDELVHARRKVYRLGA